MKKTMLISLLLSAAAAQAGHYDRDYVYANVVEVEPIYETVDVPQRQRVCYNERRHQRVGASAVIGGILGGAIGHQFGKGHGRDAATAVGVLAGASIGAKSARHNNRHHSNREYCQVETAYRPQHRITGYEVGYEYNGRVYYTTMDRDPGDTVRVQVSLDVID